MSGRRHPRSGRGRGGRGGHSHQISASLESRLGGRASLSADDIRESKRRGLRGDDNDRDGDFSMDGELFHSKRRFSPFGGSRMFSASSDPSVRVQIAAVDIASIDHHHLASWLTRKARSHIDVENIQRSVDGKSIIMTVANMNQAQALTRLNSYTYNNQVLHIAIADSSVTATSYQIPAALDKPEIASLLAQFAQSRYIPEQKLLNLSNLAGEPKLMEIVGRITTGTWTAILKAASTVCPDVETIAFNQNKLRTLYPLSALPEFLPNAINLSFAENDLSNYASLDGTLGKLKKLREVVFASNPFAEQAKTQGKESTYRSEIARRFPTLQFLDTIPVERKGSFRFGEISDDVLKGQNGPDYEPAIFPVQPKGSFFDSDLTKQTVGAFLAKYLPLFDSDRASLLDVYAPTALFSMSTNHFIPVAISQKRSGKMIYETKESDFSLSKPNRSGIDWIKSDHNLKRSRDTQHRLQHQYHGPLNIVHQLAQLPRSQHESLESYLIDAWQVPNAQPPQLLFHIHGEMIENPNTAMSVRRFMDRSIILIPSPPNSKAGMSGWPVQIVNDTLVIRPQLLEESRKRIEASVSRYSGNRGRSTQEAASIYPTARLSEYSSLAQTVLGSNSTQPVSSPLNELSPEQQQMVMQMSQQTGLNYEYSWLCLKEQGWDGTRAMEVFHQAKLANRIPPEAFLSK